LYPTNLGLGEILKTENYFITAIVTGSITVALFVLLGQNWVQSLGTQGIASLWILTLCLTIGFGLAGLVKAILQRKRV
jgi:hypothetical protein